ncbi:hypothetical protein K488DRAFT_92540 [Vararia minispora EC-137]|uniref:Uncharacterized protein n=1 Tax=Vararia minispora EC-137 TaxID=1314806 RepID=A0ACB8Q482_9AGAM|nr:hypothetical protein K488DRAFT_92540 [Vararia minispora EC-137]
MSNPHSAIGRLQELDRQEPKRALVLKTSHIGGHKYAGNVIVRSSSPLRCAVFAHALGVPLPTHPAPSASSRTHALGSLAP